MKQPKAPKPQPDSQEQAKRIDAAMHDFKQRDGYSQRQFAQALRLEQAMPKSLRGVL